MQAVQDLMKITPHGCRDGDLILMEGSAKLFNETFVHKRESADHEEAPPPEIKTDLFLFSEKGVRWFGLEGYEMTRIDMEPDPLRVRLNLSRLKRLHDTEKGRSAMTIGLPLLTSLTQTFDLRQSRRCEIATSVRRTRMSH
ncbi:hypothetical protein D6D29_08956 [Aureobasidium pullulans]|nr:hypothetical protein D6D29_08956 [Aureobasidium pullulans]